MALSISNISTITGLSLILTSTPIINKIVFASNRTGLYQIYICDSDGSNLVNLTNDVTKDDIFPRFSKDKTKITFSRLVSGNHQVFTMNVDGSNKVNVSNNAYYERQGIYNSTGTKLAFWSNINGGYDIYTMNTDGSNRIRVTTSNNNNFECDWSFDDSLIFFARYLSNSNGTIHSKNSDGTGSENIILSNPSMNYSGVRTSPDGTKLIYYRNADVSYPYTACMSNVDGSNLVDLYTGAGVLQYPSFSPDMGSIMFMSNVSGNDEIYTYNLSTFALVNITHMAGVDMAGGDWG